MKWLNTINIAWVAILAFLAIFSLQNAFISTDAPYYLSMARDISRGAVPYRDIFSSYTPVMMYLNSLVYLFLDPSYHVLLLFQYFIELLAIVFFYKISRLEGTEKGPSIFLCILLFLAIFSSDGTYINLEVYVILFVFIAYYLLKRKNLFWSGICLALGFFSKQYGVFNFLPFLLLIIATHGVERRYILRFIAGGILPLIIFLAYFVLIKQVELVELALQLTGSGYDEEMIELETTLFRFLAGSKIFLLLLFPLAFILKNNLSDKVNLILVLGLLLNFIPMFIQTVSHYFILTFPYVFILFARNLKLPNRKFILISNFILVVISALLFSRIYKYRDEYKEQLALAKEIKKEYPIGSEVFLYKHFRFLYILNDYQNPVLKEIGYRYGFKPDKEFKDRYDVLAID